MKKIVFFILLLLNFTPLYGEDITVEDKVSLELKEITEEVNKVETGSEDLLIPIDNPKSESLLESLKKKSDGIQDLLDKDKITIEYQENVIEKEKIKVKEDLLKKLKDTLQGEIANLEDYIKKNEELKIQLLLEENKTGKIQDKLDKLSLENKILNKKLTLKSEEYNTILPKQEAELELLKKENEILFSNLVNTLGIVDKKADEELKTKIYLSLGVLVFFILSRFIIYLYKRYSPKKYQLKEQEIQIFSIYSLISLFLFLVIMIFVFNHELLISLLFFGSAFVIVFKDFILSFVLSLSTVRSFPIGGYITLGDITGVISNSSINSITLKLLDKRGDRTGKTLKIPNKLLNEKQLIYSKKFILKEVYIIPDSEEYRGGVDTIRKIFKNIFGKYQVDYKVTSVIRNGKRELKFVWENTLRDGESLLDEVALELAKEKYISEIWEVKSNKILRKFENIEGLKYNIVPKKEYFEIELNYLEENRDQLSKIRNDLI